MAAVLSGSLRGAVAPRFDSFAADALLSTFGGVVWFGDIVPPLPDALEMVASLEGALPDVLAPADVLLFMAVSGVLAPVDA